LVKSRTVITLGSSPEGVGGAVGTLQDLPGPPARPLAGIPESDVGDGCDVVAPELVDELGEHLRRETPPSLDAVTVTGRL